MSSPRRRIVRSTPPPSTNGGAQQRQAERLRRRLQAEHRALARWLIRLKRAFNAFAKHQQTITRLERQLGKLQED